MFAKAVNLEASFKKASGPPTGDIYGSWGPEPYLYNLPGGSVWQIDLSRLTLSDFRMMRRDYQLAASLGMLQAMIAQSDWSIYTKGEETDPKAKKISETIEEGLRKQWIPLVRALSVAHWAGYAPIVPVYEIDPVSGYMEATRFKDLVPENCSVNWRVDEGRDGQKMYHYDGIINSGRTIPAANCVHPSTPILCADLVWRPAGELRIGQQIVAFDENDGPRGRRYRLAEIQVNNAGVKNSVEIRTDIGEPIIASVDHPFLVRERATKPGKTRDPLTGRMVAAAPGAIYADRWVWKDAADLAPGDEVAWFARPWEREDSREAGWLSGMFDGEGCLDTGGTLTISQNGGTVLDHLKAALAERGFTVGISTSARDRNVSLLIQGGQREVMRFLGEIGSDRLKERTTWNGLSMKIEKSVSLAKVQSVEPLGDQPVASIQTSCGTFITKGYLTHNTLWYPTSMENGDYYGSKMLAPAFPSWFFSQLIHLYTNRYFERFGEPTAVGYYPVDGQVTNSDGSTTAARDVMANVLQNLRSRGAVTIPSERDPETKEREWDIDYMESQMRGADFDRYIDRLDEEKSLALFTPVLMFRTGERGSFNLATLHQNVFDYMLNWMVGDMKTYLDKYLIRPLHDANFSPKAPRSEIRFRILGRLTNTGGEQMLQALIQNGGAKVSPRGLKDLGDFLGLDLEYATDGVLNTDGTLGPDSSAITPDAPNAGVENAGAADRVRQILNPGPQPRQQLQHARKRLEEQIHRAYSAKDGYDREHALKKIRLGYKGGFLNDMSNAGADTTAADAFFEQFQGEVKDAYVSATSESDALRGVADVYSSYGFDGE